MIKLEDSNGQRDGSAGRGQAEELNSDSLVKAEYS